MREIGREKGYDLAWSGQRMPDKNGLIHFRFGMSPVE